MRIPLIFLTFLLTIAPGPHQVIAQERATARPDSAPLLVHPLPVETADFEQSSWTNRVLSGLAGAALGAGIGYFASQLAQGDWDEDQSGQPVHRSTWAAVGGAGGFVLGVTIPLGGRGVGADSSFPGGDRFVITGDQIRSESLANAVEAVQFFHPEWLRQRGQQSFAEHTPDDIRVYLDNAQLGGVDDLAGISAIVIREIRYFDGPRASARWGTGHSLGAIQILTQDLSF